MQVYTIGEVRRTSIWLGPGVHVLSKQDDAVGQQYVELDAVWHMVRVDTFTYAHPYGTQWQFRGYDFPRPSELAEPPPWPIWRRLLLQSPPGGKR